MLHELTSLGFGSFHHGAVERLNRPDLVPARVASEGRGLFILRGCRAPRGELTGRLRAGLPPVERPVVGDWVLVADGADRAMIHEVLPRRTLLRRRAAGSESGTQIVASNVDRVFIVTAAGSDVNVRRLERYLAAVWDGGAEPVIVLNKIDLLDDVGRLVDEINGVARGVTLVRSSTVRGDGIQDIRILIEAGMTIALVGSSGVGKSSIVNRLIGSEAQATRDVRRDEKGRHTTTRRDLIELPTGGVLIDTPGMREFGLADADDGVETVFADIVALSTGCRFRDCSHQGEPGCAVAGAVDNGELAVARLESYHKLQRELAAFARRNDPQEARNTKRRWKAVHKAMRRHYRNKPGGKR